MEFFRILLGSCGGSVHEGYGQTETTGGTTITYSEDLTVAGHVGGPLPVCEIKLVDVVDMGYLHTDAVHMNQRCDGRGEICVRGPGVFSGYFKDQVATAEALDADGWLHTGDIGLWTPFGQLAIIDRKKNLLKLSQGEYVAVERVENVLNYCPLIAQVFVYGESTENFLIGIVVADEEVVRSSGIKEGDDLVKKIMQDITETSTLSGLQGFETVKAIWVEPVAATSLWTPENGLVTPTFKLKRKELEKKFASQLKSLYTDYKMGGGSGPRSKL
jgi:long-chain acyl-CoA synthetase